MRALTTMQAACWMGREEHAQLGGVAAHLYAEFDRSGMDAGRLQQALDRLYILHPMLRMQITAEGSQRIAPAPSVAPLEIEDLRNADPANVQQRLEEIRQQWTHQRLDPSRGQVARWCLSLLPEGRSRLHLDCDMMAVDPSSFRPLVEDLARLYEDPQASIAPADFFVWLDRARSDPALRAEQAEARQWWRQRLPQIAPAPSLPLTSGGLKPCTRRLHARLSLDERQALRQLARQQRLSFSVLLLGLFAESLARHTGDRRFRLNLPCFWRPPLLAGTQEIVGEFANVLIVNVNLQQAGSLAQLCHQLAGETQQLLAHSAYSGVNVMRDLSRLKGSPQLATVVFTAALDLLGEELFSARVRQQLGEPGWIVSQGPQVALDAQLASVHDGLLINWDIRLDALPAIWAESLFEDFVAQLQQVAKQPQMLEQSLQPAQPLNALQQAYLFGRSDQMALGGVAMQEFREYRGRLDPQLLRQRLITLVQHHPALRTRIDAQRNRQYLSTAARLNLDEIDLRHLSRDAALAELDSRREAYAHTLSDLHQAPWNLTLFQLTDEEWVVFARFDALILDGRAIAALLVELFDGQPARLPPPAAIAPVSDAAREAAAAYWQNKLATLSGAPRLPWKKPLDQLGTARFARRSLRVAQPLLNAACRLGARQQLFRNTTLMAVLLEVLSRWLDEGELCVAVPVAVPSAGDLANRSSFIAVNWQPQQGSFAERAARLQSDVLEGLEHLAFSGVDLGRLLLERNGPGPALPVVITNGLSWPALPADNPMRLCGGLTQTPQVALDLRFSTDASGDLLLDLDYARPALEDEMIDELLAAIDQALKQLASAATFALDSAALIDHRHYRFNSPAEQANNYAFLSRIAANLFAPENPHPALICNGQQLSYSELGQRVARIMGALQDRGLRPGSVLANCLPRSLEHVQLTLACALGGIVWVPIDATAPDERRRYLLHNCRPNLVVTNDKASPDWASTSFQELLNGPPQLPELAALDELSLSDTPAYYLYTSGTTGRPKCVVLGNRATANVIGSTVHNWKVTVDDVFISVTPLHHDMSVFDLFGCLSAGATLVLPGPGEDKDAVSWNRLLAEHRVTLWCSVPAILEMLLACRGEHSLDSLRLIAQGGDYIKPAVVDELRRLLPDARLISLGGPTETTIWSIWHEITAADGEAIPYGRPLPGNRYLLLDESGRHCPPGVVGRIHTAGANLALGYLQDGCLLQTDFVTVEDDQGQPARAFRTGDCGFYRRDGILMFARRVGGYVKIRGVRVSLPDVEMALLEHPDLLHVLVVDYGDARQGDAALGALYVSRQADAPSIAQLRAHASRCLAPAHVPSRFLPVRALPLTANGKPDRNRARQLLSARADTEVTKPVASASPRVQQLLTIYLEVLGLSPSACTDPSVDFVSLGLRPSHLKTISARLRETFAADVPPAQLLRWRNAADVETHLQHYLGNQYG